MNLLRGKFINMLIMVMTVSGYSYGQSATGATVGTFHDSNGAVRRLTSKKRDNLIAAGISSVTARAASKLTPAGQSACTGLKDLKMGSTIITSADSISAGPFEIPPGLGRISPALDLPAFCRVQGVLRPTSDSDIRFEVWMPLSNWNGKFEQVGNGGFAGAIAYAFMAPELQRGFAVASTDDGHRRESSGSWSSSWSIGHPEKVIDFAYRAVHETSATAKTIIRIFYGKSAAYSYFNGCSDGGREALTEAQRFPDDFNGIIAGAPANSWTHLLVGFVWDEQTLLKDPASYIPASKLPAIQAAALAACDELDGVKDGIVEDPRRCHFDPAVLQCKGADSSDCLTSPQVKAVREIYAGPHDRLTGKQIFPGYEPGAEAAANSWRVITGNSPSNGSLQFSLGNAFFTGMAFEDPKWDFRTFDFEKDVKVVDAKLASILNSSDADLRPFKAHGGKLLQYHGWADPAIAPLNSINYYNNVVDMMGGLEKTQDFYQLYMVPGMVHCAGGPGPNSFGAILQREPQKTGPEDDLVRALTRWVERGVAPKKIIATKFRDDDPTKGVVMTRPLCPYPRTARWNGKGSTNDAANFVCK